MFVPSVVFTLNVVVPFVFTVVSAVVPEPTDCAEPVILSYVVVPVDALTNATYTLSFVHVFDVYADPDAVL